MKFLKCMMILKDYKSGPKNFNKKIDILLTRLISSKESSMKIMTPVKSDMYSLLYRLRMKISTFDYMRSTFYLQN